MKVIKNILVNHSKALRNIIVIAIFLLPFLKGDSSSSNQSHISSKSLDRYTNLVTYLEENGLPRDEIQFLFLDPRVEYYPQIIYNKFTPPKMDRYSSAILGTETKKYEIQEFMKQYEKYLNIAQEKYGVDKKAIVAVLIVETKLGSDIGKYSVFNVLSSIALSNGVSSLRILENHINEKYHYLSFDRRQELTNIFKERAINKASWAKAEIANLIKLHLESHIDILELPGSYAGAFGYPQFMPTSVLKYGVDADSDGKIDLYSFPDAILSVGNYLMNKGWDINTTNKRRALLRYNNSNSYVANVLETASSIKN
ncbi:MAG: lytic murein transglycosylase [Candidatus Marinimicrobia bacterium]|nr:lytic murein transglycosylase [Candidatus Neomarinimicrobiota bacterium]